MAKNQPERPRAKFGPVLIMLLIGLGTIYFTSTMKDTCEVKTKCNGWDTINPICYIDSTIQTVNSQLCNMNAFMVHMFLYMIGGVLCLVSAIKFLRV